MRHGEPSCWVAASSAGLRVVKLSPMKLPEESYQMPPVSPSAKVYFVMYFQSDWPACIHL